jgi:hypothetical protein
MVLWTTHVEVSLSYVTSGNADHRVRHPCRGFPATFVTYDAEPSAEGATLTGIFQRYGQGRHYQRSEGRSRALSERPKC